MAYGAPFGTYPTEDAYQQHQHHPGHHRLHYGPHLHIADCRCSPLKSPYHAYRPDRGGEWWLGVGGSKLKNFKPRYYLTRPRDGKRSGALGRLKDALTGQGPDVFVTISGDRRTLTKDWPQKWQWSGWGMTPREQWLAAHERDCMVADELPIAEMAWAKRRPDQGYNFRTRKFEALNARMWADEARVWTDAHWRPDAKRRDKLPLTRRDLDGNWETRVPPWSGRYVGGRSGFV